MEERVPTKCFCHNSKKPMPKGHQDLTTITKKTMTMFYYENFS